MTTHEELQDILASHALDAAAPAERRAVETHLPSCPACQKILADFRAAAMALPLSLHPEKPPVGVKARVFSNLAAAPRFAWRPLALAAGFLLCVGLWMSARQNAWRVVEVSGPAYADGRALRAGDRLRPGARLKLGPGARADVRLASRAVFRLAPGSDATVARAGKGYFLRLEEGGILSVVKTGTRYKVQTPLASATALGTVFYVGAPAPRQTYACACAGRIHLEAPGFSESLEAEHHKAVVLEGVGGVARAASGPMIEHTDGDIAALSAHLK